MSESYKIEGEPFVRVADKNAADADRYQRLLAVLVDEYRCRFHQTRTKFLLRDMARQQTRKPCDMAREACVRRHSVKYGEKSPQWTILATSF